MGALRGFSPHAFSSHAFQMLTQTGVATPTPTVGGGGHAHRKVRRRESGIYWPRRTKSRDEQEVVAEVITAALEQVLPETLPRQIDVGLLAADLIQHVGYMDLRQIHEWDRLIEVIKRELEERDDEDILLLLF